MCDFSKVSLKNGGRPGNQNRGNQYGDRSGGERPAHSQAIAFQAAYQ